MTRWQLFRRIVWCALWQGTLSTTLLMIGYALVLVFWPSNIRKVELSDAWFYNVQWMLPLAGALGFSLGTVVSLVNGLVTATLTVSLFYPPRHRAAYTIALLLISATTPAVAVRRLLFPNGPTYTFDDVEFSLAPIQTHITIVTVVAALFTALTVINHVLSHFSGKPKRKPLSMPTLADFTYHR